MEEGHQPPSKRGRYKQYLIDPDAKIPRQTQHNWRLARGLGVGPDEVEEGGEESDDNYQPPDVDESVNSDMSDSINENEEEDNDGDVQFPPSGDSGEDSQSSNGDSTGGDEDNPEEDHPVIPGANITQEQAILMIVVYILRHNLTGEALQDLLSLFNELVPGMAPTTKFLFYKSFSDIKCQIEVHFYCKACMSYIGTNEELEKCTNATCGAEFHASENRKNGNFFLYIPISSQLRDLFENREIAHNLIDKSRRETEDDVLEDIFDGSEIKRLMREGNLTSSDFTLLWNCDGVPVFKSSGFSIWPLQVVVNELPPEIRKKNVLFNALWFGQSKPEMDTLFTPVVEEAEKLAGEGFTWTNPETSEVSHSRVVFLTAACDSVARPCIRNCMQFNGRFGCDWCLHPGEVAEKGAGRVRCYPLREPEPEFRSREQWEDDALRATPGNPVNGVKGPCMLLFLPLFNIIQGFVPDYMHCVLLGVVRQFTKLWLETSNHQNEWYLGTCSRELDNRLLSIKPPRELSRAPRSIATRSYWKATEWKSFLLYYSPFILCGLLPDQYYKHWCLLVFAMHTLLQSRVTRSMIDKSEIALKKFVIDVEALYGKEHVSFNVHLLAHLASSVSEWGPLWSASAFSFEANNGKLLKFFHGTQHVPEQIAASFLLWRRVPTYLQHLQNAPLSVKDYVQRLWLCSGVLPKNATKLGNFTLLGCSVEKEIPLRITAALHQLLGHPIHSTTGHFYKRVLIGRGIYCCESYTRSKRRIDYVVQFKDAKFGIIKDLIVIKLDCTCPIDNHCLCQRTLVVVYTSLTKQNNLVFQHRQIGISSAGLMHEVQSVLGTKTILANELERKCVVIHRERKMFITPLCNIIESD